MNVAAALRVDRVSQTFGRGRTAVPALSGVSLEVSAGEIVLVMGPSGSGKSTLLALCGTLRSPQAGRIWHGETDVTALPKRALPDIRLRKVGFVFQAAHLLSNLSAVENVRLVLDAAGVPRDAAQRRADQLLEHVRLSNRAHARPDELSAGERQRVAVARALANDPPLLLADEPTANLDSRTGHEVVNTMQLLAREQGKAVVMVTHDIRISDVADRILWIEDGRLVDQPQAETRLI